VSKHQLSSCALAVITIASLSTLLACASGGAKEPELAPVVKASTIDTSSIANGDGKTIANLFEGRFPGVTVQRAEGGGLHIRIRGGNTSFSGSDEALYVVDDVPLSPGSGGILFLNPYDIQKIEVLKNPADVGIYGVRGGNGVIKITTKRPGGRP
jgi:TonB-dependent SusC/RagA subfamily outer membrane receptor